MSAIELTQKTLQKRLQKPLIIAFCVLFSNIGNATLSVQVDKNQLSITDNLQLIITAENSLPKDLDLEVFKKDFDILSQRISERTNITSSDKTRSMHLHLTLAPKLPGVYTIPSITGTHNTTPPIAIEVTTPTQKNLQSQPLFVTTRINNTTPWPEEGVRYSVSLYSHFDLRQTQFDFRPEVTDIEVISLEDNAPRIVQHQGEQRWLKSYDFILYPDQPGPITIPGIRRQLRLAAGNLINLYSKPIVLNVKPYPDTFDPNAPWIAAKSLSIKAKWTNNDAFTVGQVKGRVITLSAEDATAQQIPAPTLTNNSAFTQFKDDNTTNQSIVNNEVVATINHNVFIIPQQSGTQTLPGVTVPWLNTTTGQVEVATIPALEVNVAKSEITPTPAPNTNAGLPPLSGASSTNDTPNLTSNTPLYQKLWWFFALGWLTTLAWIVYDYRVRSWHKNITKEKQRRHKIKIEAHKNNALQTQKALTNWLSKTHGTNNLRLYAKNLNEPNFVKAINTLEHALYASLPPSWDGKQFWHAFEKAHQKQKSHPKKARQLPSLYPQKFSQQLQD